MEASGLDHEGGGGGAPRVGPDPASLWPSEEIPLGRRLHRLHIPDHHTGRHHRMAVPPVRWQLNWVLRPFPVT